jgi:deoxyribonuclease V
MRLRNIHPWNLAPAEAIALQRRLAREVIRRGEPADVKLVAGVDIVAGPRGSIARGAVVVVSYPELEVVESHAVESPAPYPYIPGLLAFREIPVLAPALEAVKHTPDLVVVDGHGFSHPRRFGLACHLGYLLDTPTIGCAKSRLLGENAPPGDKPGDSSPLVDRGQVIGDVLRTKAGARPIYVSIGYWISLEAASAWVRRLTLPGRRICEPIRLADLASRGRLAV